MANLPSNTFLFNYNAKEYNPSTQTLPKTNGQLFDEDIVFSGTPHSYTEDYLDFSNSNLYYYKDFNTSSLNPFNRNSSNNSFTMVYKTSGFTINDSSNLFSNRDETSTNYNYMVRATVFHTKDSSYLSLTPDTNPQIVVIRVNSDGSSERKVVDANGNTLQSVSASTIEWGHATTRITFFGRRTSSLQEPFNDIFYWMYLSNETLTDSEILQVIKYNEGLTDNLSISKEEMSFSYSGGTDSLVVSLLENTWSASTNDNWISISPATGATGDTTVTISVNPCLDSRTGSVTFTDGAQTKELTVSQIFNDKIPINKLFYNGTKI